MTVFESLADRLKRAVRGQKTPVAYTDGDYQQLVQAGLRRLYVDLGREDDYAAEFDEETLVLGRALSIAEQEYVLTAARIAFFQLVQQDVNTIVGYSTNSLSVTNADKPYANLADQIEKLERRQSELFFKISAREGE